MKQSLRKVMAQAVETYSKTTRREWVIRWPGQIVLAASQVHWTAEVTLVILFFIFCFFFSFSLQLLRYFSLQFQSYMSLFNDLD